MNQGAPGPIDPALRIIEVDMVRGFALFGVLRVYMYSFGQASRLGPTVFTAWAVMIFAVQVVACQWWSRHFRFGPAEWLWRSLTYLKWQPLRLRIDSTL